VSDKKRTDYIFYGRGDRQRCQSHRASRPIQSIEASDRIDDIGAAMAVTRETSKM